MAYRNRPLPTWDPLGFRTIPAHLVTRQSEAYRSFLAAPVSTADDLYQALDGADVLLDGKSWHVDVFSVVDESDARWVQLELIGPQEHLITLRLDRGAPSRNVLACVSTWLADPALEPRVVSAL